MSERRSVRLVWTLDLAVLSAGRVGAVGAGLAFMWMRGGMVDASFVVLLVCVGVVATALDLVAPPRAVTPLAEAVVAGILIGSVGPVGDFYLPYLLVPAIAAGLRAGAWWGLGTSVAALVAVNLTRFLDGDDGTRALVWGIAPVVTGLLAGWLHWTRRQSTGLDERDSYEEAGRLLEQLRPLLRPLVGGLDARPLAARLVEEVVEAIPDASAAVVLHRQLGMQVAASVGTPPEQGWMDVAELRPDGRRPDGDGIWVHDITDREAVVASLVVSASRRFTRAERRALGDLATSWRPRLIAAALFEDVRELATMAERGRIAREMHDSVAQDIASLGYLVDDLAETGSPDMTHGLGELREEIGRIVTELRLSIHDMRPDGLVGGGLGGAIAEIARKETRAANCIVHLRLQETHNVLSPDVENDLARIAQEALTNVRRHAEAKNVWVSSVVGPSGAVISIEDDGLGMRPGASNGIGIVSMTERAVRIGAMFSIESREPHGTAVRVELSMPRLTWPRRSERAGAG